MSTEFALPGQLGRYRIVRKLGAGGMGAVYLAEDTELRRQVALKVPHFTADDSPAAIERFLREARIAGAIAHPDLCPVYDVARVDNLCFLVMPYVEGTPLSRQIDPGQLAPVDQVLALVRRVALAAQVMHGQGIIHRDLKPSNIMMRPGGQPMIMDFGLARAGSSSSRTLTKEATPLGTPAYMAPEQVLGDLEAIGPRTDIYSMGVILYELLTARLPFEGPPAVVYGQILHAPLALPSRWRPDVPVWLDAIVARAMARKPGDRFRSMVEFASALDQAAAIPVLVLAEEEEEPDVPLQGALLVDNEPKAKPQPTPRIKRDAVTPRRPALPTVTCKRCRKKLKVPPAAKGKRLFCTSCGEDLPNPYEKPKGRSHGLLWVLLFLVLLGGMGWAGWRYLWPLIESPSEITNSIGMKLVRVPAGKFTMGSPASETGHLSEEGPTHEVEITRPFYVGRHEVTQEEYQRVMGTNPSWFAATGKGSGTVIALDTKRFPVENVSWDEAVDFCRKLSELPEEKKAGRTYRLPTEAEWEYACRASTSTPWSTGKELPTRDANYQHGTSARLRPEPVGSHTSNGWKLFDVHGNVREWCSDWYDTGYYARASRKDPTGGNTGTMRVTRGGSWADEASACRSARRHALKPDDRSLTVGFRVVCVTGK